MITLKKYLPRLSYSAMLLALLIATGCGGGTDTNAQTSQVAQADTQLYTCSMHPHVLEKEPGACPICKMDLVPVIQPASAQASTPPSSNGDEKKILYWRAPMDPSYISRKPGKSPMGMDLVPVYEGEESFGATVRIDPVVQQNMGVRTAPVERRDLYQTIRTYGRVAYNEAKVAHVHTKFSGWIEKTYVNTTGQVVAVDEPLLEIYSPQLVTAQEEFLDAYQTLSGLGAGASAAVRKNLETVIASSRRRLENFDISSRQIEQLARSGQVTKTLTLHTPFEGVVTEKHAVDGMEIKSGMNLYTIADLSEIWVYADIYEYEVPWVKTGQHATMTLSYYPGQRYTGEIQYIYPYLESKSRTIKVRISFPNPNLDLKPGMYAQVELATSPVQDVVAVPSEAVIFSGERNLVIIALGAGRFAPRDVTVGIESGDGYYQIIEGLQEGETVVVSSQFLIDSESRLQESIAKMLSPKSDSGNLPDQMEMENSNEGQMNGQGEMKMNTPNGSSDHDHKMDNPEAAGFGTVTDDMLTYYTCPMESHAYVKMPNEGSCPDCGMNLIAKTVPYSLGTDYYTCPMASHAHVVTESEGNCPLCGMALVKVGA